jgi:hypothetical protein
MRFETKKQFGACDEDAEKKGVGFRTEDSRV